MLSGAGDSQVVELVGALRFNEFEGGFWSIELDQPVAGLDGDVVLQGWSPGSGLEHGSPVRVRARTRPDAVGFLMAGPVVDVLEVAPAE